VSVGDSVGSVLDSAGSSLYLVSAEIVHHQHVAGRSIWASTSSESEEDLAVGGGSMVMAASMRCGSAHQGS